MVCNAILWLYVEWLYVILDGMIIVCDWRKKERYRIKDEGWDGDVIVCGMVVYNCMWLERWLYYHVSSIYVLSTCFINLPIVFWIYGYRC